MKDISPVSNWRDLRPEELPPFNYDTAAPEMLPLLLALSTATYVDEFEYINWLYDQRYTLREEFERTSGETVDHPHVENCLVIFARKKFLAEKQASRPAPDVPTDISPSPATPGLKAQAGIFANRRRLR